MAIITGVKFRTPGKVYYFAPGDLNPKYNDHVIVETARGVEYGTIVLPVREVPDEDIRQPLKEVMRIATPEDEAHESENRVKEEEAYHICLKKIRDHGLEMKLVSAEYTFDNSKLIFYFTADGRVDFRELVKDLAGIFRTRIELRQIGVRDETKIIGGIGICGRPLCCHTYLHEFAPVSIKMAKEQNLSLNPGKISGSCGRLMCCLKNEAETYEYLNRGLPRKGDGATTPDGYAAEVQSVNILRQTVRVIVYLENDEKEMREYPVGEISFVPKKGRKRQEEASATEDTGVTAEELRELEEIEEEDDTDAENAAVDGEFEETKENKSRRRRNRRKSSDKKQSQGSEGQNRADGAGDGAENRRESGRHRRPGRSDGGNQEAGNGAAGNREDRNGAAGNRESGNQGNRSRNPKNQGMKNRESGNQGQKAARPSDPNRKDQPEGGSKDENAGTNRRPRRRHRPRRKSAGGEGNDGGTKES